MNACKPDRQLADPKELLLGFLDYYRSVIIRKLEGLPDAELRASRPLGLPRRAVPRSAR